MSIRSFITDLRRASIRDVNFWYSGYLSTTPGFAGSWFTCLFIGTALWAIPSLALRRYSLDIPRRALPFVIACLSLGGTLVLSDALTGSWTAAMWSAVKAAQFFCVPLVIARTRCIDPIRSFHLLCAYAPIGAGLGLAAALLQLYLYPGHAPSGGAGNPGAYGFAMASLALLSLATAYSPERGGQITGAAGFAMAACGILLSESRTLFPLVILFPLLFIVVKPGRVREKLILTAISAPGLVLVALAAGMQRLQTNIASIVNEVQLALQGNSHTSFGNRVELWRAAVDAIEARPILGHGQYQKMDAVYGRLGEGFEYLTFTHVHNMLLDTMVAGGALGAILLIALLVTPLISVFGRSDELPERRFVVLGTVLLCVVTGFLGNPLIHDLMLALFLAPIVFVISSDPDTEVYRW